MEIIIIALLALIGGFLLIKNYNKIDTKLFGNNNPDYKPSGLGIIQFAMITGAVFGAIYIYNQFTDGSEKLNSVYYYTATSLLVIVITIAVFNVLTGDGSIGTIVSKSLFIAICSIIAFGVGLATTFIVFVGLLIYIISTGVKSAYEEEERKSIIKTKSGLMGEGSMTLRRVSGDVYENEGGERFRRDGNTVKSIAPDEL
mgnify:CR=1 FL=1